MQTKEEIIAMVRDYRHLTYDELAEASGVDKSNLHKILADTKTPQLDTLLKITNALGLKIQIKPSK